MLIEQLFKTAFGKFVIPAKAGIQKKHSFDGLDSSLRWNDRNSYIELTLIYR